MAAAVVVGAVGSVALGQPGVFPSPPPPYVPDWAHGTFNAEGLAGFFRAAALGRVDIVCIGDSNQLLWGRGWDEAYIRAVSDRWGLYATGIVSGGENAGNGAGTGWTYGGIFPPPPEAAQGFTYGGALTAVDPVLNATVLFQPLGPLSVGPGVLVNPNANLGMVVTGDSPLDVSSPLRYWLSHATFAPGSGAWLRPSVRLADEPYSEVVASANAVNAATAAVGTQGVGVVSLDVPAAAGGGGRGSLNFRPTVFGEAFAGPFSLYFQRVENTGRAFGASVHSLYGFGGQSARDMGEALNATSDAGLSLYFSMVRGLQGPRKAVLVRIGTGVNDRSETLASLGPTAIVPGNVPAAFKANLRAIMDRVRGVWAMNNWPEEELHFLLGLSTPIQGPPDDSLLQAYRDAADQLALEVPRTAVTHFERLTSVRELSQNDWLLFDIDTFHLEAPGHAEMARRELACAGSAAAWVDENRDGEIDAEDLYAHHVTAQNASVFGAEQGPLEATPRLMIRGVRWGEAADLGAGR